MCTSKRTTSLRLSRRPLDTHRLKDTIDPSRVGSQYIVVLTVHWSLNVCKVIIMGEVFTRISFGRYNVIAAKVRDGTGRGCSLHFLLSLFSPRFKPYVATQNLVYYLRAV